MRDVSADMTAEKKVETTRGQALADEYGIKFYEASAKTNMNVVEAFTSIAIDIKKRLDGGPKDDTNKDKVKLDGEKKSGGCC